MLHSDVPEGIRRLDAQTDGIAARLKFWVCQQPGDEGDGALAVDVPGVVGEDLAFAPGHLPVGQGDHIAAVADLAWRDGEAAACGLQRAAAGEVPVGVAAEDGEDRRVAPRRQLGGNIADAAQQGFFTKAV